MSRLSGEPMTDAAPYRVSLLTAYRRRADHLRCQREWLERLRAEETGAFEWIVVEGDERPTAQGLADAPWTQYGFVPMDGPFNKAILLNEAARLARAPRLCPLDVDLLPQHGTLSLHDVLAAQAPGMLVTGYRVQLAAGITTGSPRECSARWREALAASATAAAVLGPEDGPSALRKYLLRGERFGVCPYYGAADWRHVGGVDEAFVGWGAEDQDLMARVLDLGRVLVRAYDLVYFHLPHGDDVGWRDAELTARNRERFRART
jgi:hypothetical protein